MRTKLLILAACAVVLLALQFLHVQKIKRLQSQKNEQLQAQTSALDTLTAENERLKSLLARSREENQELHRLRGEIGLLRAQVQEQAGERENVPAEIRATMSAASRPEPGLSQLPGTLLPGQSLDSSGWINAGRTNAGSGLRTTLWSIKSQNLDQLIESLAIPAEKKERMRAVYTSNPGLWDEHPFASAESITVEAAHNEPDGNVLYVIKVQYAEGESSPWNLQMTQEDGAWKLRALTQVGNP